MTENINGLIERLIAAHDGGPLIEAVPETLVPADLDAVYSMQDKIIHKLGEIGGWKVMAGGTGEPICAPIPASRYYENGATLRARHHKLVLTEIEVAVRLGRDLDGNADAAAVDAAIGALLPAIEMVGSPFVDRDIIPANLKLADLQSNGAVVVGPDFSDDIKDELSSLAITLDVDSVKTANANSGASYEAIIEAIRWLAGHAASRDMPLRSGQIIITGSRILHAQGAAKLISGNVGKWGVVTAHLAD
jgi:2-keto-4-pentenoate hydratase